ncbi:MAG: lipase family protein [Chitinophagaceae bacterium]|nr:lipase family protein [Chitinophagaceae bacterium]
MSNSPSPTIQGRMLCASVLSYSVPNNVTINPPNSNIPLTKPYYSGAGYIGIPAMIASNAHDTHAACTVGVTQDGIVIAFRGTVYTSITDWTNDLLVEPVAVPNIPGEIHDGFNKALVAIYPVLLPWLRKVIAANPGLKLYITGHSKGAAMAPIAAYYLYNNGIKASGLYLYAPPLPGNSTFASAYNNLFPNTFLYENYLDIVPLLPPSPETAGGLDYYFLGNGSTEAKIAAALITWFGLEYDYSPIGTANNTFFILPPVGGKYSIVPLTNSVYIQQLNSIGMNILAGNIKLIAAAHNSRCGGGYMGALGGGIC